MKSVIIFGTGSIAKRHSKILKKFGYKTIGVSRKKNKDKFFSEVTNYKNVFKFKPVFWIVCVPTSLHTKICNLIIANSINPIIYCEKPGPDYKKLIKKIKIKILYNLRYLGFFNNFKHKKNLKYQFVHNANAKKWHQNEDWRYSYVFQKKLGGGVVKTNSHELDLYYYITGKKDLIVKKKYSQDICKKKIDISFSAKSNSIDFNLISSITHNRPTRFFLIINKNTNKIVKKIVFYKNSINFSKNKINFSYNKMWKDIFKNKKGLLPESKETSWILNI